MSRDSAKNDAKSANSSFLYFWNEWESPEEDFVLEVQRGFSFALFEWDFSLRCLQIEGNSRFCLISLFRFFKRTLNLLTAWRHWTFRGGLVSKSELRWHQMLEVRKSSKEILPY